MDVLRRDPATAELARAIGNSRADSRGSRRDCPLCGEAMSALVAKGRGSEARLEVCTPCASVWFDQPDYAGFRDEDAAAAPVELALAEPEAAEPDRWALRAAELDRERDELAAAEGTAEEAPMARWKWLVALMGVPVEVGGQQLSRRPWATWATAAALAAVYLVTFTRIGTVAAAYGFTPLKWTALGGATIITSFFLHGSVWHLLGNAYFLLVFGDDIEDRFGRWRLLALIAASHVGGLALHAAFDPRGSVPCVGASAGISGLIALYGFACPRVRFGFFAFFIWFRVPAWVLCCLYVFSQVPLAARQLEGTSGVSALAHAGGIGVGGAVALWTYRRDLWRMRDGSAARGHDDEEWRPSAPGRG